MLRGELHRYRQPRANPEGQDGKRAPLFAIDELQFDSSYRNHVARGKLGRMDHRLAIYRRHSVGAADVIRIVVAAIDLRGGFWSEPGFELHSRQRRLANY